jgi:hypothetical protein
MLVQARPGGDLARAFHASGLKLAPTFQQDEFCKQL